MQSLQNLHVVVTGASAGVGRATAIAFGRLGCRVALLARGENGLESTRTDVEAAGGEPLVLPTDVVDPNAVKSAAERAELENGPIDIWVNSAMATVFSPFSRLSPEEFRRVTEVTYLGQVYGTMAALHRMRRRDRGTIVQVGSALSYRAIPLQSAYCGAKFAIRGFTDSLRSELKHDGSRIRLTMVQLPAVNTPQFDWSRNRMPERPQPMPPIFQPEAVAGAILKAAATTPRELWVGMSTIQAIIGGMLAPGWLDQFLARRGYEGQLSGQPTSPQDPDNLFTPVPGDHGAHGRFDRRAITNVTAVDPVTIRATAVLGWAGLLTAAACLGYLGGRRSDEVPRIRTHRHQARRVS